MADRAHPLRRHAWIYPAIAFLALLEFAWLGWFLAEPLPSIPASMGASKIRRWIFVARALPEVIPGVRFDQSYLGMALKELSHFEFLPQRIPIVLAGGLIGGAALALGHLVLRLLKLRKELTAAECLGLAYGLGTTGLGLITLVLGRLGLLAPWPVRIGLGGLIVAELVLWWRDGRENRARPTNASPRSKPAPEPPVRKRWGAALGFAFAAGPFLVLMLLGAMLPTIDFDAIEYHVQGPKEYFQMGRIAFLPHNVYTSMPFSIEMLHLLGMEVLNDWWWGALVGQLLIALYAPSAALMIALLASRLASARAGWIAAVVYLSTPWIYRLGVLPYVEGPLCYYHAALIWAVARAWPEPISLRSTTRFWLLVGLLAAGAMACKYPALISAVLPFGAIALAASGLRRSPGIVLAFILGWGIVMTPWLVKNVADTGNPVYPLAYPIFGGQHWDATLDAKWSNGHGPKPVTLGLLGSSIRDVAGRSDWQSPLYVALAPLAFLRRGMRRQAAALWSFVLYLFATWWFLTHRLDRFWLPLLPPLAVLAGLGADWIKNRLWTATLAVLMGIVLLSNFAYDSTALVGLNEWTGDLLFLRTDIPQRLNPPLARLDATLPEGAKVMLVGQAAVFHINHPIAYNTVFNHETVETLSRDRSPAEFRQALAQRGITHIYVDWFEIERYRSPLNYGFTAYVTPELFAGFVKQGVLEGPESLGTRQSLYRVR